MIDFKVIIRELKGLIYIFAYNFLMNDLKRNYEEYSGRYYR